MWSTAAVFRDWKGEVLATHGMKEEEEEDFLHRKKAKQTITYY